MKPNARFVSVLALSIAMLALPTFAADLATWDVAGDSIFVTPRTNAAGGMMLNVGAPNGDVFSQQFAAGEPLSFRAIDGAGNILGDGLYTIELIAVPDARDRRDSSAGELDRRIQTFSATMVGGAFVSPDAEETLTKDQQILDDLIVVGSACVGQDCNNGESFGFDTIRIKENNVRLHFDDTSNSASFPQNDWRLIANDSSNGGLNYLGIEDSTAGRIPFRVEAGAPANALYVEADGDVGLKTANPVVDLHIVEGNTPTLRLEQDGSDGFTPQTWDVAGNESNFFIRDVTNGSRLSFRIRPSAPESSIDIQGNGNVGIGTSSADAPLHVRRTNNTALIHVEDTNSAAQDLMLLTNAGPSRFALENTNAGNATTWRFNNANDGVLRISNSGDTDVELNLDQAGNLTLLGQVITGMGNTCANGCDRVFHPDFEVESIEEHAKMMWENSYLPAVGPTREDAKTFNLTQKTGGMLNELEKAHIYIEQLNDDLKSKDDELDDLKKRMAALEQALGLDGNE